MNGPGPGVRAGAAIAGLALGTVALARPAPSYDPWAWLLWGREVAGGTLDTVAGPAFKPLPVAVTAVLSVLGPVAPAAFVVLARAAALAALWLAFRLGRRLGGSAPAGVLAAAAVAGTGRFVGLSASGLAEAAALALALAGAEAWRGGRPRLALAAGTACALLRVEAWPFLALAGTVAWRRRPQDRPLLAALAVAVPLAWLGPELVGSGELLRSAARARVPGAGHPALAAAPALAAVGEAARQVLWPLWIGLALLAGRALRGRDPAARAALAPAAAGATWVAVVAAMAQAGFSGEARYSLPGAALVSLSGAVGLGGLVRRPQARPLGAVAVAALAVAAWVGPVRALPAVRAEQARHWQLQADLARAVEAAGGRPAVTGCGRPYVGPRRGPLAAYRLGVAKRVVEPDDPPQAPGVVFRSALGPGDPPAPAVPPGFRPVARTGLWEVYASC